MCIYNKIPDVYKILNSVMPGQPLFTHEKYTGLFVGIQDKASHMHFINGYMVGGLRLRFKY